MRNKDSFKEKVHCRKCDKTGLATIKTYENKEHRPEFQQQLVSPPLGWTTDFICKECQQETK